jgi:hypothetical protein
MGCFVVSGVLRGGADENEYRLTRHLLSSYDASVRPVENSSLPLKITFGISLHHIIDVVSALLANRGSAHMQRERNSVRMSF